LSDTPNFTSQEYNKHSNQVSIVNNIYDGVDSAVTYLRKFPKEETDVYDERKEDAALDNYVFRTVDTIKNIIFRKTIDISNITNAEVSKWCKSIDFTNNINEFAKQTLTNRTRDGYTFILVESRNYDNTEITTKAHQDAANIRPYFVNVLRKDVINWKVDEFGNFIQVSIKETYEVPDGAFKVVIKDQVRVIYNDGTIEIWREDKIFSTVKKPVKKITLVKIGSDNIPPMYDQSKINIQHLNRGSECNNYVRVGASPFLAVFGKLDGDAPKTLGINSGLHFKGTESDVKWIEMTGANYEIIKSHILTLQEQMERISVEFVTELKNATATEVEKASTANESRLNNYATELEDGFNKALEYMGLYKASAGENTISVNKDYDSNIISTEQFNALMQLRMNGDISYERLMQLLEKGELLPFLEEKERGEEKANLKDEGNI